MLFEAVTTGNFRSAKRILDVADNVNGLDQFNQTPLMRVVYLNDEFQRKNIIKLLIRKGASLKLKDVEGKTALIHSVLAGKLDALELLIPHSNLTQEDNSGNNALCHAAMKGDLSIINKLVSRFRENNLDVDKRNIKGLTPLLITCQLGYIECARVLVQEGIASPRIRDLDTFRDAEQWAVQATNSHSNIEFLSSKALKRNKLSSLRKPKILSDYLCSQGLGGLLGPRPNLFNDTPAKIRKEVIIPPIIAKKSAPNMETDRKLPSIPVFKCKSAPDVYEPVPFDPKIYLECARKPTQSKVATKRETFTPLVIKRGSLKCRPKPTQIIEINEDEEIMC
ncbi:Ankyrin repeat, SAM and basic leucine zipper domain-containing protein 1-like [Oopsacas minuta]|uniref:Ankyrin repeat, SAM and basic leucine zipper domain-containing protein 1-like n=1 Tax=Oopsacas minuta TaxID=111878 RepID=A0AAV7KFV6_9METZ|nr:Ankyrin repeat, SAM and basic leucine zipper domain-containing protein 1-like [Oopsacas minuta]